MVRISHHDSSAPSSPMDRTTLEDLASMSTLTGNQGSDTSLLCTRRFNLAASTVAHRFSFSRQTYTTQEHNPHHCLCCRTSFHGQVTNTRALRNGCLRCCTPSHIEATDKHRTTAHKHQSISKTHLCLCNKVKIQQPPLRHIFFVV